MKKYATVWVLAEFCVLSFPFLVLMSGERAAGSGVLWDFSKGLGFGALSIIGLQFILTARFKSLTHPFGIDIIYLFHRYAAFGALALILAHFGILYIWFEDALGDLNPLTARWELTSGRLALVAFALLVVTSEFRKRLGLAYGWWRTAHVALAIIGFVAAIAHVLGVGHFTAAADKQAMILGGSAGWIILIVWVRLIKPALQMRNSWRVIENRPERGDVHTLILEPAGKSLTRWKPGQFVWLTIGRSPFMLSEHPFTLSDAPEHGPRIAMSIKSLGNFTQSVVKTKPGTVAWIDGPYGAFSIDRESGAEGFVMIAGGIGITPMIANLRSMQARGDRRPVTLFYANSDWESVTFREDLDALTQHLNLKIVHVLEETDETWKGETGFLDRDILERHLDTSAHSRSFMLCGPAPMTRAISKALLDIGVPIGRIKTEIFDLV
ncbi:MAG: ferric reductase-like transmembrane domain-containing protein [Hyphomonas sp.]